jgi:hypothetical protein
MDAEQREILKTLLAEYLLAFGDDALHSPDMAPGENAWVRDVENKYPWTMDDTSLWTLLRNTQDAR